MSAQADELFPPVFTRPRGVDGDDINAAFQDGAATFTPRTADPSGKAIAAEPSISRAQV